MRTPNRLLRVTYHSAESVLAYKYLRGMSSIFRLFLGDLRQLKKLGLYESMSYINN